MHLLQFFSVQNTHSYLHKGDYENLQRGSAEALPLQEAGQRWSYCAPPHTGRVFFFASIITIRPRTYYCNVSAVCGARAVPRCICLRQLAIQGEPPRQETPRTSAAEATESES